MTNPFVIQLLLIAVVTVVVTSFAKGTAAGALIDTTRAVKSDLFAATIDLRTGAFTGNNFWLDVSVSPAGSYAFTDLSVPPAANLPTPCAMMAYTASMPGRLPGIRFTGPINTPGAPVLD